ncbi:MAG: hypothetical protein ABJB47_06715 [Actinomycetota bacterium]
MTAPCPEPVAPSGREYPGWRRWVSTTGRWWAVRDGALTAQQAAAGCVRQVHGPSEEVLDRRIREQERLAEAVAARAGGLAEWPSGWRGGGLLF